MRLGCGTFCTVNSEPAVAPERCISNARHAVGDRHRREALAGAERGTSNARHAIGDRHRREALAPAERFISNARHAVGDRILARKRSRSAKERFAVVGVTDSGRVAMR